MWILLGLWVLGALVTAALIVVGHERNGTGARSDGFVNLLLVTFWPLSWILIALILMMQRILAAEKRGDQS